MAISIVNQPSYPNAVYTPLLYTVASTQSGNPQFQFVMDVKQYGNLLVRIKQYPNPNAAAVFDPSRILSDYLSYDEHWKIGNETSPAGSVQNFNVYFGEEYGTSVSSSVILYDGNGNIGSPAVGGTNVQVFPGTVDPNNGTSFNWQPQEVLTNLPSSDNYLSYDDYQTMTFYNDGGLSSVTVDYDPGPTISYTMASGFNTIPVSTLNIGAAAVWQTVDVTANGNSYQFLKSDDCNYDRVRFAFINKYGFYDYYGVNLPVRKSTNITRQTITKPMVNYSSANSVYDAQRRGQLQYNNQYTDNYTITTDWLDQEHAEWFSEIFESPSVFVQQGTEFIPIVITNGSYVHNTNRRGQKTFQYDVTYQYANARPGR
jgi:hypothetical protein